MESATCCTKPEAVYIWADEKGTPRVSPRVLRVCPGDELTFFSKLDFVIEFIGRSPTNACSRVITQSFLSKEGLLKIPVNEGYEDPQPLFKDYRKFYQSLRCGHGLTDEIRKQVRADFGKSDLDDKTIAFLIEKAPIENDDFTFLYFNVQIGMKKLDPGVTISRSRIRR